MYPLYCYPKICAHIYRVKEIWAKSDSHDPSTIFSTGNYQQSPSRCVAVVVVVIVVHIMIDTFLLKKNIAIRNVSTW